jgi:hypothetical protein
MGIFSILAGSGHSAPAPEQQAALKVSSAMAASF